MDRLDRVRRLDEISKVLLGPLVDRTLELMLEHGLITSEELVSLKEGPE